MCLIIIYNNPFELGDFVTWLSHDMSKFDIFWRFLWFFDFLKSALLQFALIMQYYDSEFNSDMKKCFNCPNRPCGSGVVANNRLVDYRLIDFFGHSSAPFSPIGLIFSPINSLGMIYPKTKFLFVVDLRAAFMFRKLTNILCSEKKFR